ncbi:MAG: polyhydroxyalkanoate synthesis regulator DNA-binding domain-containing protein [Myxococcaceae bacterium]
MIEAPSTPPPPVPGREPKIIKRYTNRKLYDTVESRYVTLDEIAQMVKVGVEVRIIDNRNKEDLTSVTLAQIIFEEEKKRNHMPLATLRELIRRPGETLSGFIEKEVSPRVDRLLRREDGATEGFAPAEVVKASHRAFEEWQRKIDERIRVALDGLSDRLPAAGKDLHALEQRLASLESLVSQLEKASKKA